MVRERLKLTYSRGFFDDEIDSTGGNRPPTQHFARRRSTDRRSFRPIANFNVPGGLGSAEIVAVTPDGMQLIYTDAVSRRIGLVDLTDPAAPTQIDAIALAAGQTPTSVAALPDGTHVVVAVQPGQLLLVSLDPFEVVSSLTIGDGPDSVAIAEIGGSTLPVVAIENEGALPAGNVEVITLDLSDFPSSRRRIVCFAGGPLCHADGNALFLAASPVQPDDPQPEYIAIHDTRVAVTLQENNVIAILNIANPDAPAVQAVFSAGTVSDRPADLTANDAIAFVDTYPSDVVGVPTAGARIPDAIAWNADGTALFTADEGEADFEGGRGWSGHSVSGGLLFDDGGSLEATAVTLGQYLDDRSGAKGVEMEGIAAARYGQREFVFISSERGAFLAVYELDGSGSPQFVQLLPTGLRPEGVLPIPSRGLLVTSNEGSGGSMSIFKGVPGKAQSSPDRPTIMSDGVGDPWSALSGLATDPKDPNLLYAVPDDAQPSRLFAIRLNGPHARIRKLAPVTVGGTPVRFDFEGIAIDTSTQAPRRGLAFWTASEGNAASTKNLLLQITAQGEVVDEITLPATVDSAPYNVNGKITSNGCEGVAISGDGGCLLAAVQRPYRGEIAIGGTLFTRIARYCFATGLWDAYFYPLELPPPGDTPNIGLSEITRVGTTSTGGDIFAVIERDNRETDLAKLKRVYTFTLEGLTPVPIEEPAATGVLPSSRIAKTLLLNLAPVYAPYEKIEGFTRTPGGDAWVVLDNDGGESASPLIRFSGIFPPG
jgi:hypothetical protein